MSQRPVLITVFEISNKKNVFDTCLIVSIRLSVNLKLIIKMKYLNTICVTFEVGDKKNVFETCL